MKKSLPGLLLGGLVLLVSVLGGCAGARDTGQEGGRRRSVRAVDASQMYVELNLAPASRQVRSVQLYLEGDERQLAILPLHSAQKLVLEFDLMENGGRPLSAYFYHADRTWRRDLTPAEYLESFQRDDLLDYMSSRATDVPYTHYTYRFPNQSINFLVSGNYIIRVTEQGREDEVLFEQAFFVTEEATSLEMGVENVMSGGGAFPATLPMIRFTPPADLQGSAYDYDVCFVRNGRYEMARCSDRPMLGGQPFLQFYLEPELAFQPEAADYFLDLSSLRPGGQIEDVDLSVVPHGVVLEPDYARFPGSSFAPFLNGQTVVSGAVRDVAEPDLSADYALVLFSYVPPDEQPLEGELIVTGSFNNWRYDPANRLEWVPERGRYEGTVLLKQGQYEYRYFSPDRGLRRMLNNTPPRSENLYTAFIYYDDIRLNTDRLVAVGRVLAP